MTEQKKSLRPTKKDLDTAAERAGELCTREMEKNHKVWMAELQEKHPGYTYDEVYMAYRGANPRCARFSKSREPLYERGQAKNTANFCQVIGRLAIERENAVGAVRDKVTQSIFRVI